MRTGLAGLAFALGALSFASPSAAAAALATRADAVQFALAATDFVRTDCPGLAVDDGKLSSLLESEKLTRETAMAGATYRKIDDREIPYNVLKFGKAAVCNDFFLRFEKGVTDPMMTHLIVKP